MEAFSLAIGFLVIFLTISFFAFRINASNVDTNLPPGDSGWPILGETLDFVINTDKFVRDRMKKHSPDIFKTNLFGEKMVIICGPNGHKFLFSNEDKHFTRFLPLSMHKLISGSQPKSDKLDLNRYAGKISRSSGFLKPDALVNYVAGMDSIIQNEMKTQFEGKTEVKIYPFSRSVTLTLACRFFLGIENPERVAKLTEQFDKVTRGLHSLPFNVPGTAFYYAVKAAEEICKELVDIVAEKRAGVASGSAQSHDVCTTLIVAGEWSDKEISLKLMGLLVAGYSPVANTMTFFMKFVGERPDVYHKILSEQLEISKSKQPEELLSMNDMQKMKYSWAVVCEAMRVAPPSIGTFREAITDFSYAGYTVPKGWKVFWTVNTTQRNPEYFPEPYKFDPSRFMEGEGFPLYTYVPFGAGPRMCPGKEYARFVILTFVHNLVKKFKWEAVDPNEEIVGGMMPLPEKGLPVRLHPRDV
ncbi:hypothetical protein Vadar_025961 [Vaccinium darrowii]|uniref:Uncharacterized protein n=1 Tax=Vaccinium darrowii TaxID=229202 RepID=A0ACB7XT70_9ERIC|nr:hypothetical protein Vadar_025961 [Vaccinium darrowii]